MDSQLHLSPITDPKRVLDIGTGTGVWAIEMGEGPSVVRVHAAFADEGFRSGDKYPNAEVSAHAAPLSASHKFRALLLADPGQRPQPHSAPMVRPWVLGRMRRHMLTKNRVPPNVHFEVDDVESDWTYSQKFDLIFCRDMSAGIKDWPRFVRQCYE
jgi:hypothetical protein